MPNEDIYCRFVHGFAVLSSGWGTYRKDRLHIASQCLGLLTETRYGRSVRHLAPGPEGIFNQLRLQAGQTMAEILGLLGLPAR